MIKKIAFIILLFVIVINVNAQATHELYSPDKKIKITFASDHMIPSQDVPAYAVTYKDKTVLLPSRMGFEIGAQPVFTTRLKVTDTSRDECRRNWKPVYGEREIYPDNFNEMEITLQEQIPPKRLLKVVFRAYNEGIAFRYEFPDHPAMKQFTIIRELTEFNLTPNTQVWEEHGHEGLYAKKLASTIKPACELPLTIKTPDSMYAAIAEGGSSDYPRAYVQSASHPRNPSNAVCISLRGEAKGGSGYSTAWRMITIADRAGALMEQSYLLLNLNKASQIADPSWIKPGTAIRDNTLSTAGCKRFIDYAEQLGIDYVILDWGWYGVPFSETSNPSFVNVVNPGTGKPIANHTGLDIHEVVEYGKSKGVGIFLYVNRQGLERYMDQIFPIYQSWGIKGIKPGFINTGNQEWQQWTENLVKKAAEYNLMVDIHDAYRPTGLSRTYPNLLTQEGVRGNEHTPNADHNTILPFTRFTIGAGDYTPGYCRTNLQNTWTHRLSLPIIYYSPGQFLFWGESLVGCHNRPELILWKDIPVTWDDTKVVNGTIGEYAVVARRKENNWYVGGITNHDARKLEVKLDFLQPKKKYEATIYTDNADASKVIIEKKKVNAKTVLSFPLLPSGGFAVQIKEQ